MITYKEIPDEELCSFIQENKNIEKSLSELISRHSGLCVTIINSYMSNDNLIIKNEMLAEKDYFIYQTSLKFDKSKNTKYSPYLENEIKWKCLNIYNYNKNKKTIPVEENLFNNLNFQYNETKQGDDSDVFNYIIKRVSSHSDPRVKKIFNLRYVVGKNNSVMPWKYISKNLGMSIQGCINIHNNVINKLKKNIKKEIYE